MEKTIFVVDDSLANLSLAEEALEKHYRVITMMSVDKMYVILKEIMPDLILLDIAMPEMSGFDAMKQLKANKAYSHIPVIFLTALTDSYNEALGIELGAVDFINKPFSVPVLLNRIRNHICTDEIMQQRTEEIVCLKDSIITTVAEIIESRDVNNDKHIERVDVYLKTLLEAMLEFGVYDNEIRRIKPEMIISAAQFHDIGKINVPKSILNKPAPLTEEEFDIVNKHAADGEKIIERMISKAGKVSFLTCAKAIAGSHHERWDGTGYPLGRKGTEIPLEGRIMAIIDVYDALVSERPYRKAFSHEDAVAIIKEEAGKQFDPLIAGVFCEVSEKFGEGG